MLAPRSTSTMICGRFRRPGRSGERFRDERAGETEREQADHQAAQQQEEDVLKAGLRLVMRGGTGFKEHEGTERHLLLGRAADEMKQDRQRHGQAT